MTRTLPNVPLWPRAGRSGSSSATMSSSSSVAPSATGVSVAPPRPKPSDRSTIAALRLRASRRVRQPAEPLEAGEDSSLAVVEAVLDVGREEEPAAGGSDAERNCDRVIGLVADRQRDPRHAQLLRPSRRAPVQPNGGLARWQPLDLDVAPADAADAQAKHLRDGLLRRPATRERLGPVTDVAVLARRQHASREARTEPLERLADSIDADDVDAQFRRPRGHNLRPMARRSVASAFGGRVARRR